MRRAGLPVAVLGGIAATFTAAAIVGMSWHDSARILLVALAGAAIAAPAAVIALYATRRSSLSTQFSVVACAAVLVTGAGVATAARAMFVSEHDATVLTVILLASTTVGIGLALVVARRIAAGHEAIQTAARRIGHGDLGAAVELDAPTSAEITALARELDTMSRQLAAARAHEQRLDASRRELVAGMSHDLRAPIAGLVAMSEALQDGVVSDPATVEHYLTTMRHEAQRLTDLADQLFELSLLDDPNTRRHTEPTAIDDLISDAVAAIHARTNAKSIRIETDTTAMPVTIDVDAAGIARLLDNLLDNAIRHTNSGSTLRIETAHNRDAVTITLADQCGGIPPADLRRIFDPAYRGDPARTPTSTARGGLGLTIARGIAHAHGGDITAHNIDGGCRFTITLPRTHQRDPSVDHPETRVQTINDSATSGDRPPEVGRHR
jgi:signal transduction histidine kinase